MDFKEILFDSSRLVAEKTVELIGQDEEKYGELFEFVLDNYPCYSARAIRVFYIVGELHPEMVLSYIDRIIQNIDTVNNSVLRGFLKVLINHVKSLNEKQFGILMNLCFKLLTDPSAEIAHKIYSMHILYNMFKIEPLIKDELIASIESNLEFGSKGVKSIGKKMIKKLEKAY